MDNFYHSIMLKIVAIGLSFLLLPVFLVKNIYAAENVLTIVIDPGHGGEQYGAEMELEDETILEKDLNLKIAQYLKDDLAEYENVSVFMTRTEDERIELEERTELAEEVDADILISIHNNAKGECCEYTNGCTVLTSKGEYKKSLAEQEQKLACNILYELTQLGIKDQGILLRDSENDEVYQNGTLADYYAIIRNGIKKDIPSILIEHAFLDDKEEYKNFLSSDEKLTELALADSRGIARYYKLKKRGNTEILDPLKNCREKIVWIKDGKAENNEIFYKIFYESE